MYNGIKGIHLATNTPIQIDLTEQEMSYAVDKVVDNWERMCQSVKKRTGITIIGQIQIDYMVIGGKEHVFH